MAPGMLNFSQRMSVFTATAPAVELRGVGGASGAGRCGHEQRRNGSSQIERRRLVAEQRSIAQQPPGCQQ